MCLLHRLDDCMLKRIKMDGVLIEWEKMLPNPDEINELDQPDTCLMDRDLNESPTGEVTQMTSLINFMPEENKKTIKLIEELNTLQNCEKNVDATGVSFSCNNFNEKKKGTSPVTESNQNNVKISAKDNNSNVNKNEDDNSSSNKYLNGFSNCLDSPLQISDVRTGDIPSEIKTDDTLSKGRTNDIVSEIGIDIMNRGVRTECHKENIVDTKELKSNTDETKHVVKIKTQSNSLAPTIEITSPIQETTQTGFSVESNDKVPDHNLYTENSYIMLAIKQEPVDYGDYGKSSRQESEENVRHEEFMNNFYNEMNDDNEIEYKGSADHTMTASGLYQCVYCSCKIADYAQFQIHLKQRHTTLYECKYCDKKFVRSQQLAIHCRVSHTAEKEAMETLTFENLKMVIKRKKAKVFYDDDGNQIYKCAYCGKSFYVQQAMASHVRNVHHNNFKTHDKLKRGSDDHKKFIPVFKCKFCEETFKKKLELTLHMKNMHSYRVRFREKATVYHDEDGNLIYKCAYCEKEFHIQQALASHVRNKHPLSSKILKEESVQSEPSTEQTKISADLVKDEKELKFERHESLPENESKSMNPEITSPKVLPYRNMSFESDVNQIEETLASSDCSLKRELKSNQIYHCSKCTKWFYREKQVLNHEKICTFIKEEPYNEEQQGVEVHDGIDDKHGSRQEHLKQQREIRELQNIEAKLHTQVQIDIVKRLKEKMIIRKKQKPLMSKIEYSSRAREENDFLPKFFCKYCPSSFDDGKSMNLHLVKHLGDVRRTDGLYTCRICKQSFLSCRKMLCHLQNHTAFVMTLLHRQASIPECDICGQPFVNLLLLRKHQNKHVKVDNPVLSTSTSVFKTESIGTSLIDSSAEKLNTVNNADSILGHNKIGIIPSSGGNTLDDVRKHQNKHVKVDNPVYVQQDAEVHDGIRMDDHVNDVPFQCGMCLSRFPNSQYLLHHITLHMHGPYVFKIEMKDKKGTHGNEQTSNSAGNLSCYGKAFSLSLKEHDSKQVANKSDKPVILTMPKFMQLKNTSDSVSTPTSMNIVASATNVSSITQDHMYTNSLLTSIQKFQVSNMDGSDTDSAEEVNLGSVYKTGESERQLTMEKKCLPRKRKSTSNNEINYRMSNFKKCLNIAGGQWFECPLCLNLCETQRLLEVHMRSHEQNDVSMVKCGVCERQFLSKYVLSRHMEQSHKKNSYKCSICGQGFLTSEKVISHVQEDHHA